MKHHPFKWIAGLTLSILAIGVLVAGNPTIPERHDQPGGIKQETTAEASTVPAGESPRTADLPSEPPAPHAAGATGHPTASRTPDPKEKAHEEIGFQFGASETPQGSGPDPGIVRQLEGVRRTGSIEVSPAILDGRVYSQGERIVFEFFDGQRFVGIVDFSKKDLNNTTATAGKIEGQPFSSFTIASTDGRVAMEFSIPEEGIEYAVYDRDGSHYAFDFDPSKRVRLEGSHPAPLPTAVALPGPGKASSPVDGAIPAGDPPASTRVDVMILYTPAAKSYADTSLGGMPNAIALMMTKSQAVLTNSNIDITWNLVHSAQVTYTESGNSSTDLNRLTFHAGYDPWNYEGSTRYMDEIHAWRDSHGADIVGLLTNVEDTGGIGWLLNTTAGWKELAFHITRIQQATWTTTDIHEAGHNMGTHHSKTQTTQAGPGLYSYSAGWQWANSPPPGGYTIGYCSVMTYENFDSAGGPEYKRIDYFSDPNLSPAAGGSHPCGDSTNGDNATSIRNIKSVIAAYKSLPAEIAVEGNAVVIADGDSTPAAADHTDFGLASVAGGTVMRTFTIRNGGDTSLNLTGTPKVAVSGTHAADFAVTALPSSPVAAAGSSTFQVRFDPGALGSRSATLSIANDDADENPYNFAIQGTGFVAAGDVNSDGSVNLTDLIMVLQVATGTPPTGSLTSAGDANNDGKLGLAEAIYIMQEVAGVR